MKLEKLKFKNILDVERDLQMLVRNWRNDNDIKKYMYTDHDISEEEHLNWLRSLSQNKNNQVFIVFEEITPIGVAYLYSINFINRTTDWGFYLRPDAPAPKGIGALIEYKLINYVFEEMNLEKLNCEVLEINPSVIKLHKKFGFKEEGIRRKNIIKEGKRLDVYLLGLLSNEWPHYKIKIEEIIRKI